ncbi:NUDIX hydrolase [Rossellomorea aquimaris]|uniref:NUDIX hydrolase n=1 Tax=Rossellomorea TaxID=2837508 RepID=UPI001653E76A|nr:NUDIX hydrolase [Rossellomorea aquimaris]
MKEWRGAAAICLNEKQEILVVRGMGTDIWSVPSGGIEAGESPEECCIRELKEETGCEVEIIRELKVKQTEIKGIAVTIYYFLVDITGGKLEVDDPDLNIEEACWKSFEEFESLPQMYPEDLPLIKSVSHSFNTIT